MANITITVSGTPQELIQVLQRITDMEIWGSPAGKVIMNLEEDAQNRLITWNDENISTVWRNLTDSCREILWEIAQSEEGTPMGAITEKFHMSANMVGGALSSLGHQINAIGLKGAPHPWEWWPSVGYKLLPEWRNAILRFEKDKYFKNSERGRVNG